MPLNVMPRVTGALQPHTVSDLLSRETRPVRCVLGDRITMLIPCSDRKLDKTNGRGSHLDQTPEVVGAQYAKLAALTSLALAQYFVDLTSDP